MHTSYNLYSEYSHRAKLCLEVYQAFIGRMETLDKIERARLYFDKYVALRDLMFNVASKERVD